MPLPLFVYEPQATDGHRGSPRVTDLHVFIPGFHLVRVDLVVLAEVVD